MSPTLAELLDALPPEVEDTASEREGLAAVVAESGALPLGRLRRGWSFAALPARIAVAYAAWWVRSGFSGEDERERDLKETQLRAALKALGAMTYLRGALMKLGQVLAHYPHVAPQDVAALFGRLYCEAPPMHFALLREQLIQELGADPREVFAEFETRAFAAASLGQVHRARLKDSGTSVAVKVQYPDIARAIRNDFDNLKVAAFAMRLSRDWDSVARQFADIRGMLEMEADYEREAENLSIARRALAEFADLVVPQVYADYSTRRVLTMDLLEGQNLTEFMATNPPQHVRDAFGTSLVKACTRLSYRHHLMYADPQPGNYIFMPDGRLGLIDFGCCLRYSPEDVDLLKDMERAYYGGTEQDRRRAAARAADMTPSHLRDERHMQTLLAWADWVFEPVLFEGAFDFADPDYFRRGVEIYRQFLVHRYVRTLPMNTWLMRNFFGVRAMLYHLRARVEFSRIVRGESATAGG